MKETMIQASIIQYLQMLDNMWKIYFFRSWAWSVRTQTGSFFKTWRKWCPDISVVKDWKYIWLEVKNEKWRQTENQKIAEKYIRKVWWEYYVVRSVDDVVKILW